MPKEQLQCILYRMQIVINSQKSTEKQMGTKSLKKSLLLSAAIGTLMISLSACSTARYATRGNQPDPDRLAQIKPGEQTREDVQQILGSPSNIGNFGGKSWYYISEKTETVAFMEPTVTDREIIVIDFDQENRVADVRKVGLEEGKDIEPVERVTPTSGERLNAFEQIMGNFGRMSDR